MNHSLSVLKENNLDGANLTPNKNHKPKSVGIKLYNFSEITSYRKIRGPFLPQGKKEMIMEKLEMDKQINKRAAARMKSGASFVNIRYNPFRLDNHDHSQDGSLDTSRS